MPTADDSSQQTAISDRYSGWGPTYMPPRADHQSSYEEAQGWLTRSEGGTQRPNFKHQTLPSAQFVEAKGGGGPGGGLSHGGRRNWRLGISPPSQTTTYRRERFEILRQEAVGGERGRNAPQERIAQPVKLFCKILVFILRSTFEIPIGVSVTILN